MRRMLLAAALLAGSDTGQEVLRVLVAGSDSLAATSTTSRIGAYSSASTTGGSQPGV